jgi:methanogenic corrinoid protein MtbC1
MVTAREQPAANTRPEDVASAVQALAHEAAVWVANEMALKDPAAPGSTPNARFCSRADQLYHLQLLVGALATAEPRYFTEYVRWLAATLVARNVPVSMLEQSFTLILQFCQTRLAPALLPPVVAILRSGLSALADPTSGDESADGRLLPPPMAETDRLVEALIRGDARSARALAEGIVGAERNYVMVATRLVQPALYRIGALWQENRITVGQEHLATEICRSVLAQQFLLTPKRTWPHGRKVIFAAIEQDQHVLGLQIVAQAFELAGWTVQFLGANTPTGAVLGQVDLWKPDVIGLSASLVQRLPEMKRVIGRLRSEFGNDRPTVLVGGRATNEIEGVWRWTGADAWSPDAEKAVAELK